MFKLNLKSKLIVAVMLIMGVTTFMSCEKNGEIKSIPQTNNLEQTSKYYTSNTEELLFKLDTFNKSFIQTQSIITNQRKPGWFKRVLGIVAADIVGVAAGVKAGATLASAVGLATGGGGFIATEVACGVIVGASASAKAGSTANTSPNPSIDNYDLPNNLPSLSQFISIGTKHNNYLYTVLYQQNTTQEDWFINNVNNYNDVISNYLQRPEWIIFKNDFSIIINDYTKNGYNYNNLINICFQQNYLTNNERIILKSFFRIYKDVKTYEQINNITTFYSHIVAYSYLSNNEKESLISAFSVAKASPALWR